MEASDIENRFAYHSPNTQEKRDAHESMRATCWQLADYLNERLPESREKSLAVTALETVMFWGNAALARAA